MFNNGDSLALEIKNKIISHFFRADISIFFDKERNEYFISTRNKELYYSEEYGMLVLEINQNLWKQSIFNFYFILDVRNNEFNKATEQMSLHTKHEVIYTFWNVNNTSPLLVDKHIDMNNFSLAA